MEHFSIQCDSCRSNLKVRQASAVGQILSCPKCGSMVKVEAPEGWQPPTVQESSPVKSTERPSASRSQPKAAPHASRLATADFEEIGDLLASTEPPPSPSGSPAKTAPPPQTPSSQRPASNPQTAAPPNPAQPALPDQAWLSEDARNRQRMLLVIGGSAAGLLIGVTMIIFLIIQFSKGVSQTSAQVQTPVEQPKSTDPQPSDTQGDDSAQQPVDPIDENQLKPGVPTDPLPNIKSPSSTGDTTEITVPDSGSNTSDENSSTNTDTVQPIDDRETQPVDPNTPDGLQPADPGSGDSRDATNPETVFSGLRELGNLLDGAPFEEAKQAAEKELGTDELAGDFGRDVVIVLKPNTKPVDLEARLNDPIGRIKLDSMPLMTFVRFASNLSTLPITISPEALAATGNSVETPVSIDVEDTTFAELIDQAVQPIGLTAVQQGDHLLLTIAPAPQPLVSVTYKVGDLLDGFGGDAAILSRLVRTMVAPSSWAAAGGSGLLNVSDHQMHVQQTRSIHFKVARLLAGLRVARNLPADASLPAVGPELVSRTTAARPRLQQTISMEHLQPARLVDVVDQLRTEFGVVTLVDWQPLLADGWTLETELPVSAQRVSAQDALAEMLKPLKLTFRAIDEQTVQITTPSRLESQLETEFYRCDRLLAAGVTVDELAARLTGLFQAGPIEGSGETYYFDAASQCLLARLSQPKQRALEKLLTTWAAAAEKK